MIEINLVPDVKQEFLRSQRLRGRVISGSIVVCLAAGGVIVLLGVLLGAQTVRDALADQSIKDQYNKLVNDNKDLNKIVTIQSQLANISSLNDNKKITSRLLDTLNAVNPQTPNNVQMSKVVLDPTTKLITIEGTASAGFNAADALKKTILNTSIAYTKNGTDGTVPLASDVTLGESGYGEDQTGKKVLHFKMSFAHPAELLANTVTNVRVVTPTGAVDVTDSKTRIPDSLFTQTSDATKEGK